MCLCCQRTVEVTGESWSRVCERPGAKGRPQAPIKPPKGSLRSRLYTSHVLLCKWTHTLKQPVKEGIAQRKTDNPTATGDLLGGALPNRGSPSVFWEMLGIQRRERSTWADTSDVPHSHWCFSIHWCLEKKKETWWWLITYCVAGWSSWIQLQ